MFFCQQSAVESAALLFKETSDLPDFNELFFRSKSHNQECPRANAILRETDPGSFP